MSSALKDKVADTGHRLADAVKCVIHKIVAGVEKAVDFVKKKTGIGTPRPVPNEGVSCLSKEGMPVVASCGKTVGLVDCMEDRIIKLSKTDSPGSQQHFIPAAWIDHIDHHVHLRAYPSRESFDRTTAG